MSKRKRKTPVDIKNSPPFETTLATVDNFDNLLNDTFVKANNNRHVLTQSLIELFRQIKNNIEAEKDVRNIRLIQLIVTQNKQLLQQIIDADATTTAIYNIFSNIVKTQLETENKNINSQLKHKYLIEKTDKTIDKIVNTVVDAINKAVEKYASENEEKNDQAQKLSNEKIFINKNYNNALLKTLNNVHHQSILADIQISNKLQKTILSHFTDKNIIKNIKNYNIVQQDNKKKSVFDVFKRKEKKQKNVLSQNIAKVAISVGELAIPFLKPMLWLMKPLMKTLLKVGKFALKTIAYTSKLLVKSICKIVAFPIKTIVGMTKTLTKTVLGMSFGIAKSIAKIVFSNSTLDLVFKFFRTRIGIGLIGFCLGYVSSKIFDKIQQYSGICEIISRLKDLLDENYAILKNKIENTIDKISKSAFVEKSKIYIKYANNSIDGIIRNSIFPKIFSFFNILKDFIADLAVDVATFAVSFIPFVGPYIAGAIQIGYLGKILFEDFFKSDEDKHKEALVDVIDLKERYGFANAKTAAKYSLLEFNINEIKNAKEKDRDPNWKAKLVHLERQKNILDLTGVTSQNKRDQINNLAKALEDEFSSLESLKSIDKNTNARSSKLVELYNTKIPFASNFDEKNGITLSDNGLDIGDDVYPYSFRYIRAHALRTRLNDYYLGTITANDLLKFYKELTIIKNGRITLNDILIKKIFPDYDKYSGILLTENFKRAFEEKHTEVYSGGPIPGALNTREFNSIEHIFKDEFNYFTSTISSSVDAYDKKVDNIQRIEREIYDNMLQAKDAPYMIAKYGKKVDMSQAQIEFMKDVKTGKYDEQIKLYFIPGLLRSDEERKKFFEMSYSDIVDKLSSIVSNDESNLESFMQSGIFEFQKFSDMYKKSSNDFEQQCDKAIQDGNQKNNELIGCKNQTINAAKELLKKLAEIKAKATAPSQTVDVSTTTVVNRTNPARDEAVCNASNMMLSH